MTTKIKTRKFDPSEYLETVEGQREFLAAALETNDAAYIADAIGVVARARGMTALAKEAGVDRKQLYKALTEKENPTLETIAKVLAAL